MEKIIGIRALNKLVSLIKKAIDDANINLKKAIDDAKIKCLTYYEPGQSFYMSGGDCYIGPYLNNVPKNSFAGGYESLIISNIENSICFGSKTRATKSNQAVFGICNNVNINDAVLVLGNGYISVSENIYNYSNAFYVETKGNTYAAGAYNTIGADYAEYFEWEDGNENSEDRIGHFVTLTGNKIRIAGPDDDIIGAISGMSSVIGNSYEDTWNGMYERDIYGRLIYEDVEVETETIENGKKIIKKVTEHRRKINPNYNSELEYTPRSQRKEWATVGLLGQIVLIDDGTCVSGGKCTVANGGIATIGNKYRVLKRLDDTHIVILANFI